MNDMVPHILVVDDDARLRSLLVKYLGEKGWLITSAASAADAKEKLHYFLFDLMVLDVMMPGETGMAFARTLRQEGNALPILMLTAMGETDDRIHGLEAGADDYLPKPFEPRELLLRIERLLARTMRQEVVNQSVRFGDFVLDIRRRQLMKGEMPLHLTESEMGVLCLLAQQLNRPVSREQISQMIATEGEEPNPRSGDVLITRLRRKIEEEPSRPLYLQTLRGEGYILRG